MAVRGRWRLLPHLLVRRAGFPFSLLEGLAASESARQAEQVVSSRREAEVARGRLLKTLFPAEVRRLASLGDRPALRALSRWRRRVGRLDGVSVPPGPWETALREGYERWVSARRQMALAQTELEQTLAREGLAARRVMWESSQNPQVREALFLLVPALMDMLDAPRADVAAPGRAADRALERRLYAFFQRLASKNETTSFFGPLTHAQVDEALEETSFGPESASGIWKREIFPAFWAVATLAAAAAVDPAVRRDLPVRRIPASSVEGDAAWGPDGKPVKLDPATRALCLCVDDVRTVAQLAAALNMAPAEAERHVRLLEKTGFVRRDLEPLSTTSYPLRDLQSRLEKLAGASHWREAVQQFEEALRRFGAETDLKQRRTRLQEAESLFEKVTGKPAHRGEGQMYADRTVLYEDCQGDMTPARLSGKDARLIEASLSSALDLGAAYGRLRHEGLRTLATQVLDGLGGKARFLDFAAALDASIGQGALKPLDAEPERFLQELTHRLKAVSDGRVARIAPEALADLHAKDRGIRFASPDVMFEARPGQRPRAVIGEVHPYVFAWGSQGHFAPDPGALQSSFREDLRPWGGAHQMAVVLRRRRHKGLVSDAFPGSFIEVTGRGSDDPQRRLAISDLKVERGPEGPRMVGPRGPVTLYVGEDDHPHLRVFAAPLVEMPPIRFGAHTPRIELGDLVWQREEWELAGDSLSGLRRARDPLELMLQVAEARQHDGWPRFVFASSGAEPKPLCLDLEIPFAQAHLQRLLNLGPVTLVEMLPAPGQLWLQRSSGGHTSELRIAMVRQE